MMINSGPLMFWMNPTGVKYSIYYFAEQCYIIHSMNDNMGARCVVFVGAALHVVSLSRSCCSDSAGLLAVGF
jgi:hypothetical protein